MKVIAGDDEDNRRGAEGHPLLGAVPAAVRPRYHDGPDGPLDRSQGALFEAVLEPRESGAEQLQQTATKL